MLNKEKTANWARLKYLLAVPLGVGLLCASTLGFSKSYGFLEIGEQKLVQQKAPKNKQEKPIYYPEFRYDEKNNFISLEKRAIIVNGKVVADKNKFFGVAEADEIKYLNSAEATKKYGSKAGKNGAVVITGKNLMETPPPPMMPLAAPASPPKVKKGQIKSPPPIVKPDKKVSNEDKAKLMKEIELTEISLTENKKVEEIEIVPTKNFEGVEIKEGNNQKFEAKPIEKLKIVPTQKTRNFKLAPAETLNKTGAVKKVNTVKGKAEASSAKSTFEKTNNVFSKAWTLYKPKVEEKKNDNC